MNSSITCLSRSSSGRAEAKAGSSPDPGGGWFPTRAGNRLRGAVLGHGEVPVAQCLGILKRAGYNGIVSLEFEGIEEPVRGITLGLANLRRAAAEAGY